MSTHRVTPCYGRDYGSRLEVLNDFHGNKDFTIDDMSSRWDGKPINRQQMNDGDEVIFRFASLRQSFTIRVDKSEVWQLHEQMGAPLLLSLSKCEASGTFDARHRRTLVSLGLVSRATSKLTPKGRELLALVESKSIEEAKLDDS